MNNNELVSVVMPVHNGELFLKEAINGILNQTHTNFELIIVENCSTDNSLEIIKTYNDHRIKIFVEKECGSVHAYNKGFREAKGEFVVIHDQDDLSFPSRIEKQLKFLKSHDLDLCGSGFEIVDYKGNFIKSINPPENQNEIIQTIFYNLFSLFNPTVAMKISVLAKLNYFNTEYSFGNDYDFILRALQNFKCGNSNEIHLKYRIHNRNFSLQNVKERERIDKEIGLKYFNEFSDRLNDKNFVLSKFYFFYGDYLLSIKLLTISLFKESFLIEKIVHLLKLTVFIIPILLLRKRGLYYNKTLNRILNYLSLN